MSEFDNYTGRVTQGEDGIRRWYYDMDMYRNKSMLVLLERINLFTFLGVSVFGALLIIVIGGDASFARGILVVGLIMGAVMALLYWAGFYIAAAVKRGNYRIHYAMSEDGIQLVWSERTWEGFAAGRKWMRMAGSAMGSRRAAGRLRPSLDEVSNVLFSQVIRIKSYPKWDMIDLYVLGGKFQVYTNPGDFSLVEAYILERVPERIRRS